MKANKFLAVAVTVSALVLSGCGAPEDNGGGGEAAGPQPPEGVPVATSPLPLPEVGVAYNNPLEPDEVADGGTLTLAMAAIPPNFNKSSVDGNSMDNGNINSWSSPSLWDLTVGGEPVPDKDYLLSAEVISEDPQTVKYVLNPDATWNNGDPITWKAFEATWQIHSGKSDKYNPASTDGFRNIGSVEMGANEKEAIVTWDTPFYPHQAIYGELLHPANLDPELYKTGWVNNPRNELRAGPYIIEDYSNTQITLVPNPDWWGEKPKLDKVVYKAMESTASINAFQNGEIDATAVDSADRLAQIRDMEDVYIRRGFDKAVAVYTMGNESELFQHHYARRAFVMSANREQLSAIEFDGLDWTEPAPDSVNYYPWMTDYQDNLDIEHDVEGAKKLMEENGWALNDEGYYAKDGKVAEFTFVNFGDDPKSDALARAQQAMSKEAGLKMNIDNRKSGDRSKTMSEGTYDVVSTGWSAGDPFSHVWACFFYCTDSASNHAGFGTAELDKVMKNITSVADQDKAVAMTHETEAEALALHGMFPLWNGPEMFAVKAGLANYGPSGWMTEEPESVGWEK
ncbi:ABC transporter family substrate-binding protein [Arthrobacter tecti]